MPTRTLLRARAAGAALALSISAACGSDATAPTGSAGTIVLTSDMVRSLDSAATVIRQSNPGNPDLAALADSTLLTLSAGVEAKQLAGATSLSSAPLYFVVVHRVFTSASGSWQTWSLVGFDDPAHLTTLVEASGYAPTATPATAVMNGVIGDGTGTANGLMLRVAGSNVTEWMAISGSVYFANGTSGASCPGFAATAHATCALETLQTRFALGAAAGTGGAGPQTASLTAVQDVPGIRLTFTP